MRYIYITTNVVNGKSYIGQRKVPKAKTALTDGYLGSGTYLLKDIKKYGKSCFFKVILHECITQKEADFLEIQEITKRDATNDKKRYYNISKGGQYSRSEEHSEITSEYMKKFYSSKKGKIAMKKALTTKRENLITSLGGKLQYDLYINSKENKSRFKQINRRIKSHTTKLYKEYSKTPAGLKKINNIINAKNLWTNKREHLITKFKEAHVKRKNSDADYFKNDTIRLFALAKLKASNNYIGIYLIENGMDNITDIQKNINKMHTVKYKLFSEFFIEQLNLVVLSSNKKVGGIITPPKALELINKHRIQRGLCAMSM